LELVYLWVKEYKNIHEQGFNFSSRFNCDYNKKTNELTIEENDEYIPDFFGKNINVTAIVGKNGSGKSNLIELLYFGTLSSVNYFHIYLDKDKLICKGIKIHDNKQEFLVKEIPKNKRIYLRCGKINDDIEIKNDLSLIFYNNLFSEFDNFGQKSIVGNSDENKFDISTRNLINKYSKRQNEILQNQILAQRTRESKNKFVSFDNQYKLYLKKNIEHVIHMSKNINFDLEVKIPTKIFISLKAIPRTKPSSEELISRPKSFLSNIKPRNSLYEKIVYEMIYSFLNYTIASQDEVSKSIGMNTISKLKEYLDESSSLKKNINDVFDDMFRVLKNTEYKSDFQNMEKFLKILRIYIDSYEDKSNNRIEINIDKIEDNDFISLYQELTFITPDFLDFSWFPKLSTGEENFLYQFANFYSLKLQKTNKQLTNNLFIFIDEGENTLHPNWQKKYLKYWLKFLEKSFNGKNIHLILSSHSPFLLSDMPKQNIIFLDTYDEKKYSTLKNFKKGNSINVTKKLDIKPFGANIHNLLAHGFFMENGLMGEFALNKIQSIVGFYNEVKDGRKNKENYDDKIKKEFYFIRDNIGEEYIQGVINNHIEFIEEKLGVEGSFKDKRIEELEREIAELKAKK